MRPSSAAVWRRGERSDSSAEADTPAHTSRRRPYRIKPSSGLLKRVRQLRSPPRWMASRTPSWIRLNRSVEDLECAGYSIWLRGHRKSLCDTLEQRKPATEPHRREPA